MENIHKNMNLILAVENGYCVERRVKGTVLWVIDQEPDWYSDCLYRLCLPDHITRIVRRPSILHSCTVSDLKFDDNIILFELVNGNLITHFTQAGRVIDHPAFVGYMLTSWKNQYV